MKNLSSLEIRAVVDELQELVDGKVDNIYQPDNSEVTLTIHKSGIGKRHIRIMPGLGLYITTKKRKSPDQIINFCRFLRKRIKGSWLRKIEQKGFERIVEFHFEGKEQNFIMVTEFFSKGNVILCDDKYIIISALQVQLWKDRKIKAKIGYQYPPKKDVEFENYQDFAHYIEKQDKESIVKKIATLNIGGLYAEEVCARAKVDKKAKKVTETELKKIFVKYNNLFNLDYYPNIVKDNPVPFEMVSLGEGQLFGNYNQALDQYYKQFIPEDDAEEDEKKLTKKQKFELILNEQEKQLVRVEKAIGDNRLKGDWVYANYVELQEYIQLFRQNKIEVLKRKGVIVEGTNFVITIQ
jgi:predicted ribosome quality control (RQC) complex YloA/Tae2 family protein